MKLNTIMCTPGYQLSRGDWAFMGANRIQRERLGRTAAGAHFLTVTIDVPDSTSAVSFVRRP